MMDFGAYAAINILSAVIFFAAEQAPAQSVVQPQQPAQIVVYEDKACRRMKMELAALIMRIKRENNVVFPKYVRDELDDWADKQPKPATRTIELTESIREYC